MKSYRLATGVQDEIDRALANSPKPAEFQRTIDHAITDICTNPSIAFRVGRSKTIRQ